MHHGDMHCYQGHAFAVCTILAAGQIKPSIALAAPQARSQPCPAHACSLADITVVFECPSLQHAGISYNHVSSLPAAAVLQQSPLLSLDLSHNNMSSLRAATLSLAKLPQLSNLNLAGNPLCLMPDYQHSVRTSLTRLFLHDGEVRGVKT